MSFFKEEDAKLHSPHPRCGAHCISAFPKGRERSGDGDGRSVFHARIGYRMNACRRGLPLT